jgi:hypothetical protein
MKNVVTSNNCYTYVEDTVCFSSELGQFYLEVMMYQIETKKKKKRERERKVSLSAVP